MQNLNRVILLFLVLALPGRVSAADEFFDSNGIKIHYVTAGKGDPVVLLHGWMSDASMWGRDLDANPATKEFQLIALDLRGHGKSDKPHDKEKYGPEMAEDVVRLLDHLKLPKAHLVGYSMGAYVASGVAAKYPDRVLSVVYGGQAPIIAGTLKEDSREVEVFAKAAEEDKGLGSYIIAVTPTGKPKPTEAQANAIAKFMFGGKDVKALAAVGRSFKDIGVAEDKLKACKAPVLFIHGGAESEAVKNHVASIHKLLGRGEVKSIKGGDHITTLANPEFGIAILDFLRANKQK